MRDRDRPIFGIRFFSLYHRNETIVGERIALYNFCKTIIFPWGCDTGCADIEFVNKIISVRFCLINKRYNQREKRKYTTPQLFYIFLIFENKNGFLKFLDTRKYSRNYGLRKIAEVINYRGIIFRNSAINKVNYLHSQNRHKNSN